MALEEKQTNKNLVFKDIVIEAEELFNKIWHLDSEILKSNLPFRLELKEWKNLKWNSLNETKQSTEVKEYIKAKIQTYPDPRIIYG